MEFWIVTKNIQKDSIIQNAKTVQKVHIENQPEYDHKAVFIIVIGHDDSK